ncbi:MAG: serine hydrolase domain-containing protein [Janthinobacterium lividum]
MITRLLRCGGILLGLLAAQMASAQSLAAQQALDSVRAKYRLPALLAAVIEPKRIRYVYAGTKRNDQPEPISLTDYFHIGSDTKGITSLLAGKLVEQGKLQWSSKLVDVVPALRGKTLPAYADITLDQLLSHQAGIRPYMAGSDYRSLPAFTGTVSEKRLQFAQVILQQTPVAPDKRQLHKYSNAGYVLVALMLEQASHCSWEELVASTFHKLKLHYLLGFPSQTDARQPWGHWQQLPTDSVFTPLGPTHTYKLRDYMAPAGDIAMPLPDFARLVQLHLRGLLGKRNYLSAATYQTIHFGKPEYAYGWGVEKLDTTGALVSFHNGTAGTFYCHAILVPSQKVAFVVLTNQGGNAAENACNELRIRLNKLYLQGKL